MDRMTDARYFPLRSVTSLLITIYSIIGTYNCLKLFPIYIEIFKYNFSLSLVCIISLLIKKIHTNYMVSNKNRIDSNQLIYLNSICE